MSILHVNQIARRVCDSFENHIPKDDLNPADQDLRTKVQTRCLAAFAIQSLTECTDLDAGASVIDGGEDNGLDAVYYSQPHNCLVLVQSKWIKDGRSEPDSAEVSKFCNGVRDLVNSEFDRFNERLRRRRSSIENALSSFSCRLSIVLAHTGKSTLAPHATRQIQDLLTELNDATEIAAFHNLGQEQIYAMLAEGVSGGAINLEFGLSCWGKVETPHTAFYGMVTGTEVAAWWKQYRERLFAKNLRGVLGGTEVNKQIAATIENRPDDFWYFNNGITITAKNVEKTPAGGGNRDLGSFRASGAYVVNGAQTVSTIGQCLGKEENLGKIRIPLRVISLAGANEDYGILITRSNNTQNRIEARDFVSQDPEQQRIRVELQLEGIEYHIARSDSFKPTENCFDLEEATVALACAAAESTLAVLAKTGIGRFWVELDKAPYKRLFNPSVTSLHIYHAVLFQRMIDEEIAGLLKTLGRQSGKKYGVLVHGNRLIASIVFRRHPASLKFGDGLLRPFDHKAEVSKFVSETVEALTRAVETRHADNFLAVVFKNPTKSKVLYDLCLTGNHQSQMSLPIA